MGGELCFNLAIVLNHSCVFGLQGVQLLSEIGNLVFVFVVFCKAILPIRHLVSKVTVFVDEFLADALGFAETFVGFRERLDLVFSF